MAHSGQFVLSNSALLAEAVCHFDHLLTDRVTRVLQVIDARSQAQNAKLPKRFDLSKRAALQASQDAFALRTSRSNQFFFCVSLFFFLRVHRFHPKK